jgi:hypothetical protein|tara:strand:+ start:516 stop:665 length:150 start_codon:yes stop_codon:yes gene_type:complete
MTTYDIIIFYLILFWSFKAGTLVARFNIKFWQFLLFCFLIKFLGMAYVS